MAFWNNVFCHAWLPTNHILFQFANAFLFLSYFVPSNKYGLLYLRVVIFGACFCFAAWGGTVLCALDTFVWNFMFTVMTSVQIYMAWKTLPPDVDLPPVISRLYKQLFASLKVSEREFQAVYRAAREVVYYDKGDDSTVADMPNSVVLVIQGRIAVLGEQKPIKEYCQHEFINPIAYFDSAEFDDDSKDAVLSGVESETVVIIWDRQALQEVLRNDAHLQMVFDGLVACQVVRVRPTSMFQVSSTFPMIKAGGNGSALTTRNMA